MIGTCKRESGNDVTHDGDYPLLILQDGTYDQVEDPDEENKGQQVTLEDTSGILEHFR